MILLGDMIVQDNFLQDFPYNCVSQIHLGHNSPGTVTTKYGPLCVFYVHSQSICNCRISVSVLYHPKLVCQLVSSNFWIMDFTELIDKGTLCKSWQVLTLRAATILDWSIYNNFTSNARCGDVRRMLSWADSRNISRDFPHIFITWITADGVTYVCGYKSEFFIIFTLQSFLL